VYVNVEVGNFEGRDQGGVHPSRRMKLWEVPRGRGSKRDPPASVAFANRAVRLLKGKRAFAWKTSASTEGPLGRVNVKIVEFHRWNQKSPHTFPQST